MKRFGLCCAGIFAVTFLYAQVDGPFSAGTITVTPIAGSSGTWINTGNASGSDNMYATFGNLPSPAGTYTDYLVLTNFGFNLPPGATINGIIVEIERSDGNHRTSDYAINIVKGGVISTTNMSSHAAYSGSDSYQTFGDPAEMWGETWTAADINDPNFGLAIAAQRSVAGGTTAGKIDDVRITVFYDFILTPLKLISFTGTKKDDAVQLSWVTDDEINMNHYEIERSPDGINFTTIGSVASKNVTSQYTYTFMDENPLNGVSYYRLKMIGNAPRDIGYSRIVIINRDDEKQLNLYPNPLRSGNNLFISNSTGQQLQIQFYNISGQKLADITTNSSTVPSGKLSLTKGILAYRVFDRYQKMVATGKLVVE